MTGEAVATGYPWRNHAGPYDVLFGNEIYTHQQTRAAADGALTGYLYVHYTGESAADGMPIAPHADCTTTVCDVGWTVDGLPAIATFLYQIADDHAVWLVERADIPQPGAYGHFHWLGAAPISAGDAKFGYLLEMRAVSALLRPSRHRSDRRLLLPHSRGVPVIPGIDIATHLNIVPSFPGNYKNAAASSCVPLHCSAGDRYSQVARTHKPCLPLSPLRAHCVDERTQGAHVDRR